MSIVNCQRYAFNVQRSALCVLHYALCIGLFFLFSEKSFAQEGSSAVASVIDSGYYTSFDNTKIYFEKRGSGQPVLLLHGFMGSSASWKRTDLYKQLIDHGYQVILVDLRGNGKSDHPHREEAYANDAESKDIVGLMDFLKIKSYDLIGYSRGSIIAARVLRNDPRVHKAVIGGMGAAFTDTSWKLPRALYESLIHAPTPDFESMKNYVRKQNLDSVSLAYMQKQQPFTDPADLEKIKQSVLLIRGNIDSTNGSTPALQALIPHSIYVTVPGSHNETSGTKAFADQIIAFLKQ
jgi:pimeloyl-ACP methyl ester carboxylesterase